VEEGAGGAAAARAGSNLRREAADSHGLQNLLRHPNFFATIAARRRRERDTNRVTNAFLQQHAERGAGSYDALRSHARFRETEMQGVMATRRQPTMYVNQIRHPATVR